MSKTQRDIVARPRDPMIYFGYGDRVIAADEIERLREAVRAEREAILELIESARADAHLYDGDYVLRSVAAAIKAREAK